MDQRVGDISNGHDARVRRPRPAMPARSRSGARIQQLLDLSRDAFIETDAGSVLTEWNRQAELLFGWSRDEVLGRPVTEFLVPERFLNHFRDDLAMARTVRGAIERTQPREMKLLHREGHEVQVSVTAYIIGSGENLRIGGFLHDRHEEKAAEEALAHAYLYDSLTGLPNRTLFTYRLAYALAKGKGISGFGGPARARPRPLQGHQRRPRARGGGRGPRGRLRPSGGGRRDGGGGRPSGWGRVPRPVRRGGRPRRGGGVLRTCPRGSVGSHRRRQRRGLHHRQHRHRQHLGPCHRGHASAVECRRRHVPGQEEGRGQRRGFRRGHAGPRSRSDEHRAFAAPGPRAQRAPALLSAGGGDQGQPCRRRRGAPAVGSPRPGARDSQPVHPRRRGERAHHPHRRLGAAGGLPSTSSVAGEEVRRPAGGGRGQPVRPAGRRSPRSWPRWSTS